MIKVYEFNLTPDGKKLHLHIAANRTTPTTDAILNTIAISTDGDDYGVSAQAFGAYLTLVAANETGVTTAGGTAERPIWTIKPAYQQELDIVIDLEAVGALNGCSTTYLDQIYYMHLTAASEHSTCISVKEVYTIVFNKYPLYKAIECATASLDGCEFPQVMLDYLMRLKALEAAIGLGIGYKDQINAYYNWLVKRVPLLNATTNLRLSNHTTAFSRPCGCGRR